MNKCDGCKHKDNCICVPYGCECFELDLEEHDKQIKAAVIDECIRTINDLNIEYAYPHTICNILEQLKENK